MSDGIDDPIVTEHVRERRSSVPSYQAYQILHLAFIVAPTLAGLDKFFHVLTNWDQYLAPVVARLLPVPAHTFMYVVGVIEIVAGLLVAIRPRVFAWLVAAWLVAIMANLVLLGGYWDIVLRDFGLFLGALALARLAYVWDRRTVVTPVSETEVQTLP
jgi:uncharacterized membrane protein YphA (DoxX/SURF4 family)